MVTSSGATRCSIVSMACSVWPSGMCRQRRLVLARDPFGIKLLYYRIDGDRLYFGSEMRAVRATMPDRAEIDPTSLNLFLALSLHPLALHNHQGRAQTRSGDQADSPKRLL